MSRPLIPAALCLLSAFIVNARDQPKLSNVHYGTPDRQVLDFYQCKGGLPAPLLFFILASFQRS
jgi:hypothetical protein